MQRTHHDQADPRNNVATPPEAQPSHGGGARSLSRQSRKVLADVKELGAIALENVGDSVDRLKDRGRGSVAKGRQRVQMVKSGFESLVADHPVRSLLIAVGVGALLGIALRRRKAPVETVRE